MPRAGSVGQSVVLRGLHNVQVCAATEDKSAGINPRLKRNDVESMVRECVVRRQEKD